MGPFGIFLRNFEFLFRQYPSLKGSIDPALKCDKIEFLETKTGLLSAKWNGILLHSQFDPQKEAVRFADGNDINVGDHIFLYGWGLGYHVEEIAKRIGRQGRLVVMELNPEIFVSAMLAMDIERLWALCRFDFIFAENEREIVSGISRITSDQDCQSGNGWKILVHPTSFKCVPARFRNIVSILDNVLVERRTKTVFRKQFIKNFQSNLNVVQKYPGINKYKNRYKNLPALLVGAGPSLDDSLEFLSQVQDNANIFCVDTALPILTENNIVPDFIVSVDPQDHTVKHFTTLPNADVPLIISPVSNAQAVKKYAGPFIIFLQKGHSITGGFEDMLGDKGFCYAGGSVSCIALDIMMQFGFDPIIMVGMDFSYPNMKAYSSYSMESIQLFRACNRFVTPEILHRRRISCEKLMELPSYAKGKVLSCASLNSYRKNIENLVEISCQKVTFYNLTQTGAQICGVPVISFRDTEKYFRNKKIKRPSFAPVACDRYVREKIVAQLRRL